MNTVKAIFIMNPLCSTAQTCYYFELLKHNTFAVEMYVLYGLANQYHKQFVIRLYYTRGFIAKIILITNFDPPGSYLNPHHFELKLSSMIGECNMYPPMQAGHCKVCGLLWGTACVCLTDGLYQSNKCFSSGTKLSCPV